MKPIKIINLFLFLIPLAAFPWWMADGFEGPKLGLLAICAILVWPFCFKSDQDRIQGLRPQIFIVVAVMVLNFITAFYSSNFHYATYHLTLNCFSLAIYLVVACHAKIQDIKGIFWFISIAGAAVSLVSFWYPVSTVGNTNYLGAYLIFPIFTSFGLLLTELNIKRLSVALACLVFTSYAFFSARARASWVALAAGMIMFWWLVHRMGYKMIAWVFLGGAALAVIITLVFLPKSYFTLDTIKYRVNGYWPAAIELIRERPVLGWGLGAYRNMVYYAQARIGERDPQYFDEQPELKPRRAHNDYLEALVEGGVVAGFLLAVFLFVSIRNAYRNTMRQRLRLDHRIQMAICFSAIVAIMVDAAFFFPARLAVTVFPAVVMLGVLQIGED